MPKSPLPREISQTAQQMTNRLLRPVERFLHIETSSGIVLLVAAVLALLWANTPLRDSYNDFVHLPLSLQIGVWDFEADLHFFVNDILMVIFFFVVGLEIRLEMYDGILSNIRQALLPLAAACGGVIVPATIYLLLNTGQPGASGWGVPMATDIAFAVGLLTLLGDRISVTTRILLLAVAIIDDIVAIIVIALFYSNQINFWGLLLAVGGILLVLVMQRIGIRKPILFVLPGSIIWFGALTGGLHPTVAGVILGLMTPAWAWRGGQTFLDSAKRTLEKVQNKVSDEVGEKELLGDLAHLDQSSRESISPAVRLVDALHPWVAFVILPLFALMNAGVDMGAVSLETPGAARILLGIIVGLVIGKPLGVFLFTKLGQRFGWVSLPDGVSWHDILVLGCVSGIGFTMSLFIGALAFADPEQLALAKLAILAASVIAAVLTLILARKRIHL